MGHRRIDHPRGPFDTQRAVDGGDLADHPAHDREPTAPRKGDQEDIVAERSARLELHGDDIEAGDLENCEVGVGVDVRDRGRHRGLPARASRNDLLRLRPGLEEVQRGDDPDAAGRRVGRDDHGRGGATSAVGALGPELHRGFDETADELALARRRRRRGAASRGQRERPERQRAPHTSSSGTSSSDSPRSSIR